jgi:hypothetical protein
MKKKKKKTTVCIANDQNVGKDSTLALARILFHDFFSCHTAVNLTTFSGALSRITCSNSQTFPFDGSHHLGLAHLAFKPAVGSSSQIPAWV